MVLFKLGYLTNVFARSTPKQLFAYTSATIIFNIFANQAYMIYYEDQRHKKTKEL
jgi:hypothetical protein